MDIVLNEVKEALRIDYDDEDKYLQLCIDVAKSHLESAIDNYEEKILNENFQMKAKLVIIFIIQDIFDNRSLSTDKDKIRYSIKSLMAQMRW